MKKSVIVDTNILLHYKRLNQIDWRKEMGVDEVEIVITPVVLRELESEKTHDQDKRYRRRAAECVRWLHSLLSSDGLQAELRHGVTVRFLAEEPVVGFGEHRLDRNINDDWLVAHAVQLSKSDDVVVVTADSGVSLKCRSQGVHAVYWEENDYRLPELKDDEQRQIKELEAEISRLRNRIPVLTLKFPNGEAVRHITLHPELTSQGIKAIVDEKWRQHQSYGGFGNGLYVMAVRDYCDRYEDYAKAQSYYQAHVIRVELQLANSGSCVANDIDICLSIPPGPSIQEEWDLPSVPEPPDPEDYRAYAPFLVCSSVSPPPTLHNASGPDVDTDARTVSYHVQRLKHTMKERLRPFFLEFQNPASAGGLTVDYTLLAADVPDEVRGTISLVLDPHSPTDQVDAG